MKIDFKVHEDARSREMVEAFRVAIQPVLDLVAPNWTLHHIETFKSQDQMMNDKFEVRLIIKPIGNLNEKHIGYD